MDQSNGSKNSIYGSLPEDWPIATIGELVDRGLAELQTGPFGTVLLAAEYRPTGIPVVAVRDIYDNKIILHEDTPRVETTTAERLSQFALKVGDILFARKGAVERRALVTEDQAGWLMGSDCIRLRLQAPWIFPTFISYVFGSPQHASWITANSSGSTMPSLNQRILSGVALPLPPLPEQRRIAEILGTWDEAIALTERLIQALEVRRTELIRCLVSGELRFPEFEEEWCEAELQQIVTPVTRREPVDPEQEYRLIGVRWYVAGAHIHEVLLGNQIATEVLSRIHENDIVYNKMWVSKSAFAIAQPEHHGAYGTTEYPQFEAVSDRVYADYLGYVFHDSKFQYDATALCKGTTGRARLNPSDFLKIQIQLPPLEEQRQIADVLQTCDEEIALYRQCLASQQEQKRGLMQQLLTGQIRVGV